MQTNGRVSMPCNGQRGGELGGRRAPDSEVPDQDCTLADFKEGLFRGARSRKEANVAGSGASSPEEKGCVKKKKEKGRTRHVPETTYQPGVASALVAGTDLAAACLCLGLLRPASRPSYQGTLTARQAGWLVGVGETEGRCANGFRWVSSGCSLKGAWLEWDHQR